MKYKVLLKALDGFQKEEEHSGDNYPHKYIKRSYETIPCVIYGSPQFKLTAKDRVFDLVSVQKTCHNTFTAIYEERS